MIICFYYRKIINNYQYFGSIILQKKFYQINNKKSKKSNRSKYINITITICILILIILLIYNKLYKKKQINKSLDIKEIDKDQITVGDNKSSINKSLDIKEIDKDQITVGDNNSSINKSLDIKEIDKNQITVGDNKSSINKSLDIKEIDKDQITVGDNKSSINNNKDSVPIDHINSNIKPITNMETIEKDSIPDASYHSTQPLNDSDVIGEIYNLENNMFINNNDIDPMEVLADINNTCVNHQLVSIENFSQNDLYVVYCIHKHIFNTNIMKCKKLNTIDTKSKIKGYNCKKLNTSDIEIEIKGYVLIDANKKVNTNSLKTIIEEYDVIDPDILKCNSCNKYSYSSDNIQESNKNELIYVKKTNHLDNTFTLYPTYNIFDQTPIIVDQSDKHSNNISYENIYLFDILDNSM